MPDKSKKIYLFNCDNTYDLTTVEECLTEVGEKYDLQISFSKIYFRLQRMAELVDTTLPTLEMDFAIFVVHANESRLSINEENAGIGYAKLYRALLQKTNDKVLIVIGGDAYYKDEDEKGRSVISRWARRKVASQFNEAYLDGRKSFIFSWDKKHRPIHEEALRHYFDPSKKGFKFVYTPPPKPLPRPIVPEPEHVFTPPSRDELPEQQPYFVEDNSEPLINDHEDGRGSFNDWKEEKRELRSDMEKADQEVSGVGGNCSTARHVAVSVLLQKRWAILLCLASCLIATIVSANVSPDANPGVMVLLESNWIFSMCLVVCCFAFVGWLVYHKSALKTGTIGSLAGYPAVTVVPEMNWIFFLCLACCFWVLGWIIGLLVR